MYRLVHSSYSNTQPIVASSFSHVVDYMNKYDCIFITAYRSEYSHKQNIKRNKQLADDIHSSELTYIKAKGGFIETIADGDKIRVTEDTFCVVNNRYRTEDFIKLGVSWCKKYDQDAVLITTPTQNKNRNYALNVVGRYYTQSGAIDMKFDNATIQDAEEYFTNICGKDFVLSSTELFATDYMPYSTTAGYVMAKRLFRAKYPDL